MTEGSGQEPPASKPAGWAVMLRAIRRWALRLALLLPLVLLMLPGALYVPAVQSWVRSMAMERLSSITGTPIGLEALHLRFPLRVALEGLHVPDAHGDTLLHAGTIIIEASLSELFHRRIDLRTVHMAHLRARLLRDDQGRFNFDHLVKAFEGGDGQPADTSAGQGWGFTVGAIDLEDLTYDMDLGTQGPDLTLRLGRMQVSLDALDLDSMKFHLRGSRIQDAHLVLRTTPGGSEPDDYPDLLNPVAGFDIRSGPLLLNDVSFALVDAITGDSLWVNAGSLIAEPGTFDLSVQHVPFERIVATGLLFGMLDHPSASDDVPSSPYSWPGRDDGFRCYLRDWNAEVKHLLVTDARFELHADSVGAPNGITDADHVVLDGLLLDARQVEACNDHVAMDLRVLHANTVQGPLDVAMDLTLEPHGARVPKAMVAFARQTVHVSAHASWPDMRAAITQPERITFRSVLDGRMETDPLVELLSRAGGTVKGMDAMHTSYRLHAMARGSLLALEAVEVGVRGSDGTELELVGAVDAPLGPDRLAYELDLHRFVPGAGLHRFMQAWAPNGAVMPKRIALAMKAKGSLRDVAARVDLRTDLGDAKGTAAVWGLGGPVPDGFRVDMDLKDLRLVNLLGDSTWGSMGLHVQGAGQHLGAKDRQAWLDVEPDSFVYEGKDFSALCVTIGVDGDSMLANIDLSSRPLGFMLRARALLPGEQDSLRASADIELDHIHLKELGLTDHVLRFGGAWHFEGARAPDGGVHVAGEMDSTRVWNLEKHALIERARWSFTASDSLTQAMVEGDAVRASIRSNMPLDTLMDRIAHRVGRHFTAAQRAPGRAAEVVELDLALPRTDWITDLVVPDLHALSLERCHVRYAGDADQLEADVRVPHLVYDSLVMDTLQCRIVADSSTLDASVDLMRARYGAYTLGGVGLDLEAREGTADVELSVSEGRGVRTDTTGALLRVGTRMTRMDRSVEFRPHDKLMLNGRAWRSATDGLLRIGPGGIEARDFMITDGRARLALETEAEVELVLVQFELGDVLGLVTTVDTFPVAGGVIDGRVRLPVQGAPLGAQVVITELAVKGVDIGRLTVGAHQPDAEHVSWAATLVRGQDHAETSGSIAITGDTDVKARTRFQFADLSWARGFLDTYLSALDGSLRGDMTIAYAGGRLAMDGRVDLDRLRIGSRDLGQVFTVAQGTVLLAGERVTLQNVTVLDSLQEAFRVGGSAMLSDPADPVIDLALSTERFHWVNSTYADNPDFYGDLFAGLELAITGRVSEPSITGRLVVQPGTDFTLVMPGSKVEMVDGEGVVVFTDDPYRERGDSMAVLHHALQDSLRALFGSNTIDVRVGIDKAARFAFMLDPASGDQATVRGEGDMRFRYDAERKMDLDGAFKVEEGGYTLSLYGLVRKRFDLVKGGEVKWSGDPMDGAMDISANYRSSTAPLALVEDEMALSESERNRFRKPLPFDVYIDIAGTFTRPDISFRLDLPAMDRKNYAKVSSILDKLAQKGNEEQLNRQVFGLLVLNSFIPSGAASDEGNLSGTGIATSTARNSVNGLLTDQLNALSGQYLKNVDISVGVNTYDQSQGGSNYQRTSVDYKVSQRLFNDRVTVEVGGSVGVDEHGSNVGPITNTNTVNYAISYTLTPDGRYRARAFHEPGYDLYDGEITISGVSLQYTKELEGRGKARMRKHGQRAATSSPTPETTPEP